MTDDGKIKVAPHAVLQYRQIPRKSGSYDIPVAQWLVHWENLTPAEATWEDAQFIRATFPNFHPWSLVSPGEYCQDPSPCTEDYRLRYSNKTASEDGRLRCFDTASGDPTAVFNSIWIPVRQIFASFVILISSKLVAPMAYISRGEWAAGWHEIYETLIFLSCSSLFLLFPAYFLLQFTCFPSLDLVLPLYSTCSA